jgi:hypothetical protein
VAERLSEHLLFNPAFGRLVVVALVSGQFEFLPRAFPMEVLPAVREPPPLLPSPVYAIACNTRVIEAQRRQREGKDPRRNKLFKRSKSRAEVSVARKGIDKRIKL